MFVHNLKYTIKSLFRNKVLIFWTFIFPIILGVFFNMAFSNIEKDEELNTINIAIIDNINYIDREIYINTLEELTNNEDKLFNIKYTSTSEAIDMLDNSKIDGYIDFSNNKPVLVVKDNGINETIINSVINEITYNKDIINNVINDNKEVLINNILDKINNINISLNNISNNNLSYMQVEYYTLIAMACMYGGMLGLTSINRILPNMSNIGKRISISPNKKSTLVLASTIGSYIVSLVGIIILLIFLKLIINVDFGNHFILVILLSFIGDLAGIALGVLVASLFKISEGAKTGIMISISMFLSVLSGMIGVQIKYFIDTKLPIISMINPNNMITDGFYSLYYYDTFTRFIKDIISLIIFIIICIVITSIKLRSDKYDSI